MRIALAVDGVITDAPEFFAAVTQATVSAGHEIHVLTDFAESFREQRERELAEYGIAYDTLVITADKLGYCEANGIEFAVGDDPSYFREASTPIPVSLFRLGN